MLVLGNIQISYDVSGKGVCSNRQIAATWGTRLWPNRHITFIVSEKV